MLMLLPTGCGDSPPAEVADDAISEDDNHAQPDMGVNPEPDITQPEYGDVALTEEQQKLVQVHAALLAEAQDMSTEQLMEKHYQQRPYLAGIGFDALEAEFMDLITEKLQLSAKHLETIGQLGFAVIDSVRYPSHPMGYRDLFVEHIPVLITTDSILFAVHKSYDTMLREFEESTLIPLMSSILEATHQQLGQLAQGVQEPLLIEAMGDVDLFYTMARSLLSGAAVAPIFDENVAIRDELLAKVEGLQPELITLFGRPYPCAGPGCAFDFSQFKPRGHYTLSEELEQYFRAMIWLGRTEIVLTRFHREFLVSEIMRRTIVESQSLESWESFDKAIQVFVGKSDNLTPTQLDQFMTQTEAPSLGDLADPAVAQPVMELLESGGFGNQQILSQIIAVDPMSDKPPILPPIFLFMGQRFVVDSYVFSNVVFDRIYYQGQAQHRYMPSPLDAMFVLGFQEALPPLQSELDTYHYSGNLSVLRGLVDAYAPAFWQESMYNVWLDSIRSLGGDFSGSAYPEAMRTQEYARKLMHTGLASWAELRHDTILYAKQSYTGVACDYPDGYVEPIPAFYQKIAEFAQGSRAMLQGLELDVAPYGKQQAETYFNNLETAAIMLKQIADRQLAQEPRLPEETKFIKELVQDESMCGSLPFSGWYANLFFNGNDTSFDFDPTVADVHTDPNSTNILHVATGYANAMVMVVNTTCGTRAYVGPVSSYYEHFESGFNRLTDEDWKGRLSYDPLPARPAWTNSWIEQ